MPSCLILIQNKDIQLFSTEFSLIRMEFISYKKKFQREMKFPKRLSSLMKLNLKKNNKEF
jgi:hypothetical protein